ncbi:MAG: hypothetical protein HC808_11545 [Candidatus Competibacteraceae bacterium]|nr:hypothetical protein [Candidatus Competibacteraceae bacterium]
MIIRLNKLCDATTRIGIAFLVSLTVALFSEVSYGTSIIPMKIVNHGEVVKIGETGILYLNFKDATGLTEGRQVTIVKITSVSDGDKPVAEAEIIKAVKNTAIARVTRASDQVQIGDKVQVHGIDDVIAEKCVDRRSISEYQKSAIDEYEAVGTLGDRLKGLKEHGEFIRGYTLTFCDGYVQVAWGTGYVGATETYSIGKQQLVSVEPWKDALIACEKGGTWETVYGIVPALSNCSYCRFSPQDCQWLPSQIDELLERGETERLRDYLCQFQVGANKMQGSLGEIK